MTSPPLDDADSLCRALLADDASLLHQSIGLYPAGPKVLDPKHRPATLASPAQAHLALFTHVDANRQHATLAFAIHDLDGKIARTRHFQSFPEMVGIHRRHILSGSRASARGWTDPQKKEAYAHASSPGENEPLTLTWGLSFDEDGASARSVARHLLAGLLALTGEGWLATPLGVARRGPLGESRQAATDLRERLEIALAANPASKGPSSFRL